MVFVFVQKRTEKTDYLVGGAYGQLTKAWKDYNKAKLDCEDAKIKKFQEKINSLEAHLELKITQFNDDPSKEEAKK